MKLILDLKIQVIKEMLSDNPEVEITYFIPDTRKDGGKYETIINNVKKIDSYHEHIIIQNILKIDILFFIIIFFYIFKNISVE